MWLACVSVLAAFDICPPVKDGEVVLPSGKFLDGSIRSVVYSTITELWTYFVTISSHPEPFDCVISPRSVAADNLLGAL